MRTAECKFPKATQTLVKLLFDQDMFKEAMALLKAKGTPQRTKLEQSSPDFYTVIPDDFGWQRPPVIFTDDQLKRYGRNMLNTAPQYILASKIKILTL